MREEDVIKHILFSIIILAVALLERASRAQELPSWNEGPAKTAITRFVERVTTVDDPDFVPPDERVAVFDNDGTLWSEKPFYFQLLFALDRVKELAPQHPEWEKDPTLKAAIDGDVKSVMSGGEHALLEIVMATHAGTTTDEFEFAYDRNSSVGRLDKGLAEAVKNGWTMADMKKDWKIIYPKTNDK